MQSNDKTTHLIPWLSFFLRLVLLVALCFALYQVQVKWLDLHALHLESPLWLCCAFLLIPLNLGVEWLRFKKSMEVCVGGSDELWDSFLQGLMVSFFTPSIFATTFGRMRLTQKQHTPALVFSGVYCGLAQFTVTLGFATLGASMLMQEVPINSLWIFLAVFLVSGTAFILSPRFILSIMKRFEFSFEWSIQQKAFLFGLSVLRYLVFSFQFHALLQAFGQDFSLHQVWVLMMSYGFITLSPSILFGKIVVREGVAVAVFSFFLYPKEPVFVAAFLTWLFNVVLPLIFAVLRILFRWKSLYS